MQKLSFMQPLLLTGVVAAGIAGLTYVWIPKVDQYLKLKAFDDCARATTYTYESTENGKEATDSKKSIEPVKEFYVTCIKDKGYTTQTK